MYKICRKTHSICWRLGWSEPRSGVYIENTEHGHTHTRGYVPRLRASQRQLRAQPRQDAVSHGSDTAFWFHDEVFKRYTFVARF